MTKLRLLAAVLVVAAACSEATTSPVSDGALARFAGAGRAAIGVCASGPMGDVLPSTQSLSGIASVSGTAPVSAGTVAGPGSSVAYCPGIAPFTLTVTGTTPVSVDGYGTVQIVGQVVTITSFDFGWTVTFTPQTPPPSNNPTDKNACMKNGWAAFGFKNQGQCVRFIETGKDSR